MLCKTLLVQQLVWKDKKKDAIKKKKINFIQTSKTEERLINFCWLGTVSHILISKCLSQTSVAQTPLQLHILATLRCSQPISFQKGGKAQAHSSLPFSKSGYVQHSFILCQTLIPAEREISRGRSPFPPRNSSTEGGRC